jgi:LmbE family N-acetylglucosaminyl deacetylase
MLGMVCRRIRQVLLLGAHADDIEIGCGGTILKLLGEFPDTAVHWVVFSAAGRRREEATASATGFLAAARARSVVIHAFRDGYFPYDGAQIKDSFEQLKETVAPDVIFTHHGQDLHQDHRLLSELTWNTFRDHLILEYEIPKYDGGLGSPNFFVPLTEEHRQRKLALLMTAFPSQASKSWFTAATFEGLMRLRGIECASRLGYAEAFYCRKLCYG